MDGEKAKTKAEGSNDAEVIKKSPYYMNFMYNKISVPKMVMVEWLKTPEFIDVIKDKMDHNINITDETVYDITKEIYFKKRKLREVGLDYHGGINHTLMRKGLRALSKKLFNDENYWLKEYEEFWR